ncbi:MAG: HlyD family efflux transporter periplasmic adaptor subunit [Thermoguttaceae bacterium]|nr:HlyD family efflux transporter periplasmic adaptor subunit [Thermoguttaceae bacterium]
MMNIVKKIVLLLIIVGVGVGVFLYAREQKGKNASVQDSLTYYGNVEIRRVNMSFRVGGRITEILAEEGDELKKGQLFAKLDVEPLEVDVQLAKAALDKARAALEKAVNGARKQEIEEAKAQADECRATLELAEADLVRNENLIGKNAVSQSGYDASLSNRDVAKARLARALANVELLEEGTRKEDVDAAKAAVAQAEASLQRANIALDDAVLTAPNDGVVLTRVAEPGAIVAAGQTVASLSVRDVVWVYIFVEEPDLGKVAPGARVVVTTDSSEKTYVGHVGYISPEAEFTPKTVETPNLRTNLVYRARIVVDAPDLGLRQGAPVDVKIPLNADPEPVLLIEDKEEE